MRSIDKLTSSFHLPLTDVSLQRARQFRLSVIGLLRGKLWYYPMAIVVFLGFIVYQVYRYYVLQHSILLLAITVLDIVVVALIWHEWRYLRARVTEKSL